MNLSLFDLLEPDVDHRQWLERQLTGPRLGEIVAELEALYQTAQNPPRTL